MKPPKPPKPATPPVKPRPGNGGTGGAGAPAVTTAVSRAVVGPGEEVYDQLQVRAAGLLRLDLYGPFATRASIDCAGTPYRSATLRVTPGAHRSPDFKLPEAGYYNFRARLKGATSACGIDEETVLAAPAIVTGRSTQKAYRPAPGIGGNTPSELRIDSLRIKADVAPVGIDLSLGVLGVPDQVERTGWWRDGRAPGARSGVILVAGHIDSASKGPGAFYQLPQAKPGELVHLKTKNGRSHAYRITSVRSYLKAALPKSVWSTSGPARLVIVTCGGPFDVITRHYRNNVVVTAAPA